MHCAWRVAAVHFLDPSRDASSNGQNQNLVSSRVGAAARRLEYGITCVNRLLSLIARHFALLAPLNHLVALGLEVEPCSRREPHTTTYRNLFVEELAI